MRETFITETGGRHITPAALGELLVLAARVGAYPADGRFYRVVSNDGRCNIGPIGLTPAIDAAERWQRTEMAIESDRAFAVETLTGIRVYEAGGRTKGSAS